MTDSENRRMNISYLPPPMEAFRHPDLRLRFLILLFLCALMCSMPGLEGSLSSVSRAHSFPLYLTFGLLVL